MLSNRSNNQKNISPLEKAMRLLDVRAYSEQELLKKLCLAKIPMEQAEEAVAECCRRGYLNDKMLADDSARSILERGSGLRMVKMRLRKRGIHEEDVENAIENATDLELDSARRALAYKLRLLKKEADPRKKREKVFSFLVSRGFSMGVIRTALDEISWNADLEDLADFDEAEI